MLCGCLTFQKARQDRVGLQQRVRFAAVVDDVVGKKRPKTKGEQDVVFAPSEPRYTWKER
jgi:hypothetical protein